MAHTATGPTFRRGRKAMPWRRYWVTVLSGVMPTARPVAIADDLELLAQAPARVVGGAEDVP
jgi:hypothetical protein